jgi:DNA-binding NtrC family response regulator
MKILLLEDDVQVTTALMHLLQHLGHEGLAAQRIDEAVALFTSTSDIAVAIADSGLKDGEDGLDLLHWLAEHRPAVQRILTSGFDCPPDFVEDPPQQRFLHKPFGIAELKALFG